jgi:hypothetical protein
MIVPRSLGGVLTTRGLGSPSPWGASLAGLVYRANRHDSKVFSCILADLIVALKQMCPDQELVIVLDKGNNSKENFKSMDGKIS